MYEIGWFSTGRDAAARELLLGVHKALEDSGLAAHIHFVFSNREPGESAESDEFFKLVKELGLELVSFSSARFEPLIRKKGRLDPQTMIMWREDYDREVLRLLAPYQPQVIVLAGYMLIASSILCDFYNMINLHPAEPGGPKGTWQEVIWQLIEQRAEETGVTVHLVTPVLDGGPPITYCTFPIRGEGFDHLWRALDRDLDRRTLEQIRADEGENQPLFAQIRQQGIRRELPLLTRTVLELAQGNLQLKNGQVFQQGKPCPDGCCLSGLIEAGLL
jgi:folate-dependent phosphoribosylglycinamide formyltransferase PurN